MEALVRYVEKWGPALDNVPVPLCVVNKELEIFYTNQAMTRLIGKAPTCVIGEKCRDLFCGVHPMDSSVSCPALSAIRSEKEVKKPVLFRAYNTFVDVAAAPVLDEGNRPLGALWVLMSGLGDLKQKKGDTELDILFGLVEEAHDLIQTISHEGKIVYVNKAWTATLGYDRDEVLGRNILDFLAPDTVHKCRINFEKMLKGESMDTVVAGIRGKNGENFLLEGKCKARFRNGKIVFIHGIFRDVTRQKEAENALKASQERLARLSSELKTILDNSVVGICYVENRTIKKVNKSLEKDFGYSSEELVGQKTHILFPSKVEYDEFRKAAYKYFATGKQYSCERLMKRKDGTLFWCRIYGKALDASRPESGSIWVYVDVTELHQMQEERKLIQQKLFEWEKRECLADLAGGMAHDFNNLLTTIQGSADLLAMRLPSASSYRGYLNLIEESVKRASMLTDQLLIYSGTGGFVIEDVDLSRMVKSIAKDNVPKMPSNIELRLKLDEDLPPLRGDPMHIYQVVSNLVENAIEATLENGGWIEVSTGTEYVVEPQEEWIFGTQEALPGNFFYVVIKDSGTGIDPRVAKKLFDPFFSTKFIGRGLGLCAVLGIVRGHGGFIGVKNLKQGGSLFKVYFPRCTETRSDKEPDHRGKTTPEERAGKIILVIDDELEILELVRDILEMNGYKVLTARDGIEAIGIFEEEHGSIDLVLLDLTMPGMNGIDVYKKLKKESPGVKVIFTSGYNQERITNELGEDTHIAFIQKPFRSKDLVSKIDHTILG